MTLWHTTQWRRSFMALGYGQPSDLMGRSQAAINQAVDRGTTLLADRVEHYTNVARDVSEVLRERGEPQAAGVVETLAQRVGDVARYLRTSDGTALWSDVQMFSRDKGWLLAGAGFLGGLAAARAVRTAVSGNNNNGSWERTPAYVDSYASPSTTQEPMMSDQERSYGGA
jgi:hypothetical protein